MSKGKRSGPQPSLTCIPSTARPKAQPPNTQQNRTAEQIRRWAPRCWGLAGELLCAPCPPQRSRRPGPGRPRTPPVGPSLAPWPPPGRRSAGRERREGGREEGRKENKGSKHTRKKATEVGRGLPSQAARQPTRMTTQLPAQASTSLAAQPHLGSALTCPPI